jgi:hypothetical protein
LRALRTQEVVKVCQGVRQAQGSGGDGSTLLKSHGVREGDEATWAARNASIACSRWRGSVLGSRRRVVKREGFAETVERVWGEIQVVGRIARAVVVL